MTHWLRRLLIDYKYHCNLQVPVRTYVANAYKEVLYLGGQVLALSNEALQFYIPCEKVTAHSFGGRLRVDVAKEDGRTSVSVYFETERLCHYLVASSLSLPVIVDAIWRDSSENMYFVPLLFLAVRLFFLMLLPFRAKRLRQFLAQLGEIPSTASR